MKTFAYLAIAANGAVANHQGGTPWGEASWRNYIDAVNATGNLIMGRTTYDVMEEQGEFNPFDPGVKLVVVSSRPAPAHAIAEFVPNPQAALELLRDQPIVLVGGGPKLLTSMIATDLVDELHLDIEPILLGGGAPLIPDVLERRLRLLDISRYDTGITLKYAIDKSTREGA